MRIHLALLAAAAVTTMPTVSGRALPPPHAMTLDDQFAAVALRVPEFAGMALVADESILRVDLTDASPQTLSAAAAAIAAVFGPGVVPTGGLQARRVSYGFLQLHDWYDILRGQIIGVEGVVFTDIDEARNRLRVGVVPGRARSVAQRLGTIGIPREVVLVEETEAVVPLSHTLQATVAVKHGGYVVTSLLANGIGEGTIGFNATRAGVPGFVTVSHGTQVWFMQDTQAGYPATWFFQSSGYYPQHKVGVETLDPSGPPCAPPYPSSHNCRFSDSVFVTYDAGVKRAHGVLARTTGLTQWDGAAPCANPANPQCVITVDHTIGKNVGPGMFAIGSGPTAPYLLGLQLQKVGRVTGWTRGSIDGTCLDYVWSANGATVLAATVLRCQYQVGNLGDSDPTNDWWRIATKGDSGSPVFRITSMAQKRVELYGLLWGGNTFGNSFGGKRFVFSPIANVQADLGPLDYYNPCLPPFPVC